MIETDIARASRARIGSLPGVLSERMNTGAVLFCITCRAAFPPKSSIFPNGYTGPCRYCRGEGRQLVTYGTPGGPDQRLIVRGRFLGLEFKSDIGRQSADQKTWQRACEAAGGIYVLVRDPEDAARAVEAIP